MNLASDVLDVFYFSRFFSGAPIDRLNAGFWILIVVFSICVHECAHAYQALKEGDDTAQRAGHLSLNPLVQMGPFSLILLLMIGIAWGAVPVDESRMRNKASGARVAFAGPAANLLLAILFSIGLAISRLVIPDDLRLDNAIILFFNLGAMANLVLFSLNMLPLPPLDGWRVYAQIFPAMRRISPGMANAVSACGIIAIFMTPLGAGLFLIGYAGAEWLSRVWEAIFTLFMH